MDLHETLNRVASRFESAPISSSAPKGSPESSKASRNGANEVIKLEKDEMITTFYRASHSQYRDQKDKRWRFEEAEWQHK